MIDDYSGLQKAAILLITLGPEKASAIFQHLKEDEIESLTLEIANTRSVSPQDKESVLDEYYQVCLAQQYIAEGGIGYAKELLEKALGSEKAQGVISKLTASLQVRPFEFVRKTEPAQLLNFIQDEHPQTIAMILSYLSSSQAAMILGALPPEKQADVARRIAQMDRTSPDVIKEVERVLERKLSSLVNQDYTIVGGIDSIVNILNSVDRATEKRIMESLEVDEPELAEEIRKKMFVFEDILLLDDRSIQRVLRDVENADLELALKSSTEELQNVIFRNLVLRFGQPETIKVNGKKPRVVFFVGPTGVGKTTTIAKIASKFKVNYNKNIAFITADTYRIAATDQLRTFANILDTPLSVIYTATELNSAVAEYEQADVIFVDTAGFSHKNETQRNDMRALLAGLSPEYEKSVYLVLSATTKYRDLISIIDSYKDIADYKLIFTKLDETSSYGNLLNIKLYSDAGISYVTNGQNVPDDIEVFDTQKIVKQLLGGRQ